MPFPFIPVALGVGLLALFGFGKKDDDEDAIPAPKPSGKGGNEPQPEPEPGETIGIINSGKSTVLEAGKTYHILSPIKVVNPGEATVYFQTIFPDGTRRDANADEIVGLGWSATEPNREYVIEVNAPGRYHVQMMEGADFNTAFIAEWNITAE